MSHPDPTKEYTDHECEFKPDDIGFCSECKEHAEFCDICGSECCGAGPFSAD